MGRNSSQDNPRDGHDGECTEDEGSLTRRQLVATGAATWATVSTAGCTYITDPGPDGGGGPSVSTETSTTDDPNGTPDDGGGDGGDDGDGGDGGDGGDDSGTATPTGTPCEGMSRFAPGMEIGIHARIRDSVTGSLLGGDDVESVTVEFPEADYPSLELNWNGPHERFSPETWGSKIVTDSDTEPGTYEYQITVRSETDGEETTITDHFVIV